MKIGYLVPEFPGQTHNFFWREAAALKRLGVVVQFLSTRHPPPALKSTTWGKEIEEEVDYLFPLTVADAIPIIRMLVSAQFRGVRDLARIIRLADVGTVGRLRLVVLVPFAVKLAIVARCRQWSHVHVHSSADSANLALFANVLFGLTYSITLHNYIADHGANQKAKWQNALFGIFITEDILKDATDKLEGAIPRTVAVAPMGVDLAVFRRRNPYSPFAGTGPIRAFCCARLNHGKGFDHLIRSICHTRSRGYPVTLEIAGEDDVGGRGYRVELEALIARLDAGDYIKLRGAISEEAVRDSLEQSHLFVLASLWEGLGVAIMEAMAMELPVIATNVGGVPSLVKNGVTGLLVEPAPTELAEAIIFLARAPDLAYEMGKRARRRIERHFSSDVSAEAIARLLQQRIISATFS